jgi:hypothetical protein
MKLCYFLSEKLKTKHHAHLLSWSIITMNFFPLNWWILKTNIIILHHLISFDFLSIDSTDKAVSFKENTNTSILVMYPVL